MDNYNVRSGFFFFPLIVSLLASGCSNGPEDFIDMQGSYGDGTPVSLHVQLQRISCCRANKIDKTGKCIATVDDPPCTSLKALKLLADEADWFRGLRITYTPSQTTTQMAYPSALVGPVTVYAVRAVPATPTTPAAFVDSDFSGGEIQFGGLTANPGDTVTGTLGKMVLSRPDNNGVTQTLLTLDKGSFQYFQP